MLWSCLQFYGGGVQKQSLLAGLSDLFTNHFSDLWNILDMSALPCLAWHVCAALPGLPDMSVSALPCLACLTCLRCAAWLA